MTKSLIAAIAQYIPLSSDDRKTVNELFEERLLASGEKWLHENEICRHLGFIEKGLVRFYITEDGREITHFFATEGAFISNFESFLKKTPSRKTIEAIEPCTIWTISRNKLEDFYHRVKHGERFGRLLMEKELLNTIARFLEHYTKTPLQRYEGFLEQYDGLQQRIPQYHIASYVAVQPPSLSRIRKRMAAKAVLNQG